MNIKNRVFILILSTFLIYSCGTYRINNTSDLEEILDLEKLNGQYFAYSEIRTKDEFSQNALGIFNVFKENTDFINLTFEEPNKLKLNYLIDTNEGTVEKEVLFEGKRKKKFLEIYFSKKQFLIPIVFNSVYIDRIRIGQDRNGDLIIRNLHDNSGNILFIGGGSGGEKAYYFKKSEKFKGLFPIKIDDKWGYSNSTKEIIILPKYDFAYVFNHNTARIKLNGKWGLINSLGKELTPIQYDSISLINTYKNPPIYFAEKNNKKGALDTLGNEIIPVIYDEIDRIYEPVFRIRLGNKYGFATREKIVVPAIYSEVNWYQHTGFAEVKRDDKIYVVDKEGFEYETEPYKLRDHLFINQKGPYKILIETKRKTTFEKQITN